MSVLPYCVTLDPPLPGAFSGVGGETVLLLRAGEMTCYYSRLQDDTLLADSGRLKEAALEFHHLIANLLMSSAVLPFRFPTLLGDVADLEETLREQHSDLARKLAAMGDGVQMEVRLSGNSPGPSPANGAEYLKQKAARATMLNAVAEQCRQQMGSRAREWRAKEDAHGLRLFAMVNRSAVVDFRRTAEGIRLPEGVHGRVSGPWPAMAFAELTPERSVYATESPAEI